MRYLGVYVKVLQIRLEFRIHRERLRNSDDFRISVSWKFALDITQHVHSNLLAEAFFDRHEVDEIDVAWLSFEEIVALIELHDILSNLDFLQGFLGEGSPIGSLDLSVLSEDGVPSSDSCVVDFLRQRHLLSLKMLPLQAAS